MSAHTLPRVISLTRHGSNPFEGRTTQSCSQLRKEYDPDGLFFVHHGVGSERWSVDGFTRLT